MMDNCDNGNGTIGESSTEAITKDKDEFIVVQPRGRRKKNGKGRTGTSVREDIKLSLENPAEREETESRDDVIRKIGNCIKTLEKSTYYGSLIEKLEETFQEVTGQDLKGFNIICLGLGIFSSHHLIDLSLARFQLALLVLLKERFQSKVEVFDPAFISQEKSILTEEFGFTISEVNQEGKYKIDQPTLLFLPHCPHQLVNNLLDTNWKAESLTNCYILSNSLSSIALSNFCISEDEKFRYISKALSVCTEIPISNEFKENPKVFNEMSIHVFPRGKLENL